MRDKARKRRETFKAEELYILLGEVEANQGLLFERFKSKTSKNRRSEEKDRRLEDCNYTGDVKSMHATSYS